MNAMTLNNSKLRYLVLWFILSAAGCNDIRLSTPKPIREGTYLVHVVSPGGGNEEIDTILIWYTGSENTRSVVQDANKGKNLSQLHPGQHILIPRSIVTQTNPLPRRKFSFGREASKDSSNKSKGSVAAPVSGKHGSQNADPLEEILSKQAAKQGAATPAPKLQNSNARTPETFDLEESQEQQQPKTEVIALPPQREVSRPDLQRNVESQPSDIDAMLKKEQEEVDALRRELAPQAVESTVDPDEHLP
jgi:hypothetical protein